MTQMHHNINSDINMKNNTLFGFTFYSESKSKLIDQFIYRYINKDLTSKLVPAIIFTPNPEQIMLAQRDPVFASALHDATVLVPDGVGLIIASRLLSFFGKATALSQRISGIDLFQELVARYPKTSCAVIGGTPNENPATVEQLSVNGQSLPWIAGYANVAAPTESEEEHIEKFLRRTKPEVLFVAFGAPYQELWSLRHRALLNTLGVKVVLVVGGAVDVFSGKLKRAPKVLRLLGLEWLFRLVQEPWRWKRQLNLIHFIGLTVRTLFSE